MCSNPSVSIYYVINVNIFRDIIDVIYHYLWYVMCE